MSWLHEGGTPNANGWNAVRFFWFFTLTGSAIAVALVLGILGAQGRL